MNTKVIIAVAAFVLSMGSASTFAAGMPKEPQICAVARSAITRNSPAAPSLIKQCAEQGGDAHRPPPLALGRVVVPAVVLPPLVIGAPAPAPAPASQPSGSIDVTVGGNDNSYDDGISCGEGRSIVRHSGFRKVHAMDCSSDVFTYSATKHDQLFKVFVNSDGDIVHVSHLY